MSSANRRGVRAAMLVVLTVGAGAGCVATLPFDELTGGAPKAAAHYGFEEGSGTVASDGSGRHPALLEGEEAFPQWTQAGKRGGALDFPPDDGWLFIPSLSESSFPPRATLAVWVRVRSLSETEETDVFGIEEDDDVPLLSVWLTSRAVVFERFSPSGDRRESITPPIEPGAWALVVAGWDVPANRALLYVRVDGRAAYPTQTGELPPDFAPKSPYLVAAAANGTLDELRFYDRLLSDSELSSLD